MRADRLTAQSKKGITNMENPIATIEMENGGIMTAELYPDIARRSRCIILSRLQTAASMTA